MSGQDSRLDKCLQTLPFGAVHPGHDRGQTPAMARRNRRAGHIVGVLVAGIQAQYGSGLNFAVPIARVCEHLRSC